MVIFIFNSANISSEALRTLASELGPPRNSAGKVEIHGVVFDEIHDLERTGVTRSFVDDTFTPEQVAEFSHETAEHDPARS